MSTESIQYEITPPKGLVRINWLELWRFRELFYIFVWRDIKVRYKQTAIGISWAIFQPLLTMLIFTIFFGRLAKVPSDNIPYPVFVFTGLVFWTYFQTALSNATSCLVDNENIIKKVYFPRLILPISTLVTPMIDFVAALVILFCMMAYFHYVPGILGILVIPFLLLMSLLASAGLGLFFSSVNVKFRDVKYALPFFIQILLFVTPVIYPISIIPERFQWVIYLNPLTGVITIARSLLLQVTSINWMLVLISVISSLVLALLGIMYFRKTERFFADEI